MCVEYEGKEIKGVGSEEGGEGCWECGKRGGVLGVKKEGMGVGSEEGGEGGNIEVRWYKH